MASKKAAAAQVPEADTRTLDLLADVAPAAGTALAVFVSPAQRAVEALSSKKREVELAELVTRSTDITEVKNGAARAQVHQMAMDLKNARCAITSEGKAARDDATKFSKAVIAEEARLIAITGAEEERLFKLRDDFDKAEADAKAEQERLAAERRDQINTALGMFISLPARLAAATSAEITAALTSLANKELTEAEFGDKLGEAAVAIDTTAAALIALRTGALAREQAEADRIRLQEEEKQRLIDQAAELVRQQEVAAETKRQLDAQAAQVAADRRAQELAAEQLVAQQRLQRDAMQKILAIQQLGAAVGDARSLDSVLIDVRGCHIDESWYGSMLPMAIMARDLAETTILQRYAAAVAAELPAAHAEALDDNALFDAERAPLVDVEPLVMGCPTLAGTEEEIDWDALPDTLPLPESVSERDALIDSEDPAPAEKMYIADMEIVDLVASEYGLTRSEAIVRLAQIDFKSLEEFDGRA